MNLKERWTKQNNSIKLLLRKLRRHDTFVVAIAVVLALCLCGGLIYLSTPVMTATAREELEQTERENSEKTIEKLDELGAYLDGLDKTITENNDTVNNFYKKNSDSSEKNDENTEKITNNVNDKVSGLGRNLDDIHKTIADTKADIDNLKKRITYETMG